MRYLILFTLLILVASLRGQPDPPVATSILDLQQATSRLAEARAKLGALPAAPAANSPEASLRQAWERRVELLDETVALLTSAKAQDAAPAETEARRKALAEKASQFAALPKVTVDESPTEEGFADVEARITALRDKVAAMRAEEANQAKSVESITAQLAQARSRLQSAQARSSSQSQLADAAPDPGQKEILLARVTNADLDAEVARLQTRVLNQERELEKILAPLQVDERGLAERQLARAEQEFQLYRQALGQELDRQALLLDQELARLTEVLATAQSPPDRFIAEKKLGSAQFVKNKSEHGRFLLVLRSDLEEQERRLAVEGDELKNLKDYLAKAGASEQAAERLRSTMQRVKLRRQALERTLRRDVAAELSVYRSRRFELEDQLFFLKESWQREVEAVILGLPEAEGGAFRAAADVLLEPYGTALRNERDVLTDLIGVGQELQVALIERRRALGALETFIRSRAFWMRDAKPLGPELWPRVKREAEVVTTWAREVRSPETSALVSKSLIRPGALAPFLLLIVGLPIVLYWIRQRLRRFVKRMNDLTVQQDVRPVHRLLAVGAGLLSVALLPVYLFVASRLVNLSGLPETVAPVLGSLLKFLSITLLFWFMSRSFFAGRGTAQVQFGMDPDAAHNLHRSLRVLLAGYLVFFSVYSILSRPPFILESLPLEVLPRLAYTLFLVLAVTGVILLLQPRSAFSRYWSTALGDSFLGRRWPLLASLFCLAGVVIVGLEIGGYRYSSRVLAGNLCLTLTALLVLVPLYRGVLFVAEAQERARQAKRLAAAQQRQEDDEYGPATPADDAAFQVRTPLRLLFVIAGVVLIARLWGLDSQVLEALDQTAAYDIRGTGEGNEFVSYGDLLRAVLYAAGTYLFLKYLPGIYEYGIFSRLEIESGLKYAILTMSRYGIFTLGIILVLSQVHLDLGRLGWLMAAMGVGLGFGLQEIVSNFVSGIILLVERPVRVGDVVTVGQISGKVQRINIRATSVINFDRQEIIVPNRSLITKEVTNWTRGDTIIRLVVPIGVAYGSDIDQVTNSLLEIVKQHKEILTDPAPQAIFMAHGASSLDFELRVFIPDPSAKMRLLHSLNRKINQSLVKQGIEIPFPQRDLHIRSTTEAWPAKGPDGTADQQAGKTETASAPK